MSFDLKKFNPYELAKINTDKIKKNIKPLGDEFNNVTNIINNDLTKEQYEQLYIMFIKNLSPNKISMTGSGIMLDLNNLSCEEFYKLENLICNFIYNGLNNNIEDNSNENNLATVFTADCDYSNCNKDLYVQENIEINMQQPVVSNYLDLYEIKRSLPSLKNKSN
ncbi:MAG: hypothetical protein IJ997_01035 [Mycoplasmataceae bacterium]|nr:hypothetical protein [Mycoplasmataceae bacterium]